jgi:thioredoxin-related protein
MKAPSFAPMVLLAGTFVLPCLAADEPPAQPNKPQDKKPIYDEKADAKAQIQAALCVAQRDNRRVLIDWGANWCHYCVQLEERFRTDPDLKKALRDEYVVVYVDIDGGKKNLDLGHHYQFVPNMPSLTVLDSAGKVVGKTAGVLHLTKSADGKESYDSKQLLEFLTTHKAEPLKAEAVLQAAMKEAARTEREVFLHFGAPWCGWCLRLEAWLAQPGIAAIIGKDFVDVKIDQDRMIGGKELLDRYNAKKNGGIPWFVFLDAKGKVVVTSDGPKGNIGFPYEPHEIDYFMVMLKTARHRITGDDMEVLRRSLVARVKKASAAKE